MRAELEWKQKRRRTVSIARDLANIWFVETRRKSSPIVNKDICLPFHFLFVFYDYMSYRRTSGPVLAGLLQHTDPRIPIRPGSPTDLRI